MINKQQRLRCIRWLTLLTIIVMILQTFNLVIINAIPIRQDPNMSVDEGVIVGINNITSLLKKLSNQLNDTTLERYQREILNNASIENYTSVNELLNELRTYLKANYMNKSLTEEEASGISLVSSTDEVNSGAVSVNMTEALRMYAELIRNKELVKSLEKLTQEGSNSLTQEESEALIKALNKIVSVIKKSPSKPETFPQPPKQLSPQQGVNLTGFEKLPNLPTSLPKPNISTAQIYSLKLFAAILLAITMISGAIYAVLKVKPRITRSLKKYVVTTLTRFSIGARGINDPVIKAYALTLKQLELLGTKKLISETPREFLERVKPEEYRQVLEKLTPAYELRAYSHRKLRDEVVNKLMHLVKKVVGPV